MPRLSKQFKEAIEQIPVYELKKLVVQMAAKDQEFYDHLNLRYINGKDAEQALFEETKEKVLGEIWLLSDRGILQKNLAKTIGKAVKHINYFVKTTKNKAGEAELLLSLLDEIFENYADELGTCWTVFDSKLAITTNRFYNLVTKKLHEDYLIEYRASLNSFLKTLQTKSRHLDYVYDMPKSLEI